jgi:hypothetical protein
MEVSVSALQERLARTERRERTTRCLALLSMVGTVLLLTTRPATTQNAGTTVKAPFKVVDGQNRTILDVVTLDGRSALRVYNRSGKTVAGLADAGGTAGGRIVAYSQDGLPATALGHSRNGGRLLLFNDGGLKEVAELSAGSQGGSIILRSAAGRSVYRKP